MTEIVGIHLQIFAAYGPDQFIEGWIEIIFRIFPRVWWR